MNFIYMGTAEIAVKPMLALIAAGHNAVCAVTQPDKANSRGNKVVFSAVKQAALEHNIPVYQPEAASSVESYEYLSSLNADVTVVCAYGQLLKTNILTMNRYGCINLHASLLPDYRGANPIQRAIQNGEKKTGVTVMYMNEGLDTGDMMIKAETEITDTMTFGELTEALSENAAALAAEAIDLLENGAAPRTPQPDGDYFYAEKLTKDECIIDFNMPAKKVYDLIRSLDPVPGAVTELNGRRIKIFSVALPESVSSQGNGSQEVLPLNQKSPNLTFLTEEQSRSESTAVSFGESPNERSELRRGIVTGIVKQNENKPYCGLIVACGTGEIIIQNMKPEGKQLMKAVDFYNGLRLTSPAVFGKNNG